MPNTGSIKYENISQNMSDGILIVGYDGIIRLENEIAADILEIDAKKLTGNTIASLMAITDKNDDFFQCLIDAIFTKQVVNEVIEYHTKGKTKYLRLVVSFLKSEAENTGVIVVINDITELVELNKSNEELTNRLIRFVDQFVQLMITAIEKRSPYNANHTRNMVGYAIKFLNILEETGKLRNPENRTPFLASVWLHDIGKLIIPLEIMDKPTRLGDSEKDVYYRIELAILCERIRMLENPEETEDALEMIAKLEDASELILKVNKLGFLDDETYQKVIDVSKLKCLDSTGRKIPILDDYELESLCVRRGTLTDAERKVIQSHASYTRELLSQMEFDGIYENVPKWASQHHEYLDGTGYPDGIKAEDISWEVRILTIIDVYDALTADDRPYKPPVPPEKAFAILRSMADEGKIDRDILEEFIASNAWVKD
ncbi:MAG: HD domain-containing protein [Eubacterium sp.]|nr:HD domain-containing protein [Eubacterium sp.]